MVTEHDLQCAQSERQQTEANVIDSETRLFLLLHVRRVGNQRVREQQGNDSDRNIEEENPPLCKMIRDPSAKRGANRWRKYHSHAVNCEGHAALRWWECIRENCLLAGL